MQYWLVKSEPGVYSWKQFENDGVTGWEGVRNYQARNNLKSMKKGDWVLFYHSNQGTDIQGIARVHREFFQDPTTEDSRWVSVELKKHKAFKRPVSLEQIKREPLLENIGLIRQSRLSVMPLTQVEFDTILAMGN